MTKCNYLNPQAAWPYIMEPCYTYNLDKLNELKCYAALMSYVGAHLGVLNSKSAEKKPNAYLALVAENYFFPTEETQAHAIRVQCLMKPKQAMNAGAAARACLKFFKKFPNSPLTKLGAAGLASYSGDL